MSSSGCQRSFLLDAMRMRNTPISELRTLVFITVQGYLSATFIVLCCFAVLIIVIHLLTLSLFYNRSGVIKHYPQSLHQTRTSTTFSDLLVLQHATFQAAYVTGLYLTLVNSTRPSSTAHIRNKTDSYITELLTAHSVNLSRIVTRFH